MPLNLAGMRAGSHPILAAQSTIPGYFQHFRLNYAFHEFMIVPA